MIETLLSNINIISIIIGALFSVLIGMVWFNPKIFGSKWAELAGLDITKLKSDSKHYVYSLVAAFALSAGINFFTAALETAGIGPENGNYLCGIMVGIIAWLSFTVTSALNPVLWEKRSKELFKLNMAHQFVNYISIGTIATLFSIFT